MKSRKLKHLVGKRIRLEDYYGMIHNGQVLVREVLQYIPNGEKDNHYYFQREDGKTIRITRTGFSRVIATEEGLALKLRCGGTGRYQTQQEFHPRFAENYRFENMVLEMRR